MSKATILVVIMAILTVGCATGEKARNLNPGMSMEEVKATLGKPDGFSVEGEYVILKYTNKLVSGWSWDTGDYAVILKNDRVVDAGFGEVRTKQVGSVHSVFLYTN